MKNKKKREIIRLNQGDHTFPKKTLISAESKPWEIIRLNQGDHTFKPSWAPKNQKRFFLQKEASPQKRGIIRLNQGDHAFKPWRSYV